VGAQRPRRCFVGREERLDRELGNRDVDRGAEGRDRAEEAQFAIVGGAEDERDEDLAAGGAVVAGVRRARGSR
jgi:hypothetical protein